MITCGLSVRNPCLGNYINYTVNFGNNMNASMTRSFHDIIVDIDSFLERTRETEALDFSDLIEFCCFI